MKKRAIGFMITCCMIMGMSMMAQAQETKIEKIEIEFSWDKEPKQGEEPGDISAKALNSQYRVLEVYFKDDVDVWELGDTPEATAVLAASDGYRFSNTSKSTFTIGGCEAKYKRARHYDGASTLELTVTFPQLIGRLNPVENLYWEDNEAVWDEMEGVRNYEVKLYRDDRLVTTATTSTSYYNFTGFFTKEGSYTFKVRGIAQYNSRGGDWSEPSDANEITRQDAETVTGGNWVQDAKGWWYTYGTGGYPADGWFQIEGAWYYFNRDGYILTGWQRIDRSWYYLGSNGVMLTGWQQIDGRWYCLDGSGVMLTGWQQIGNQRYYMESSGAMLTGWQTIDRIWYYLEPSGALLTNARTPDGYYVDYNGEYRP